MGAKISNKEFMDIILASLPPSYDAVMNALTTFLEECGKALEPDNMYYQSAQGPIRQKKKSLLQNATFLFTAHTVVFTSQ